MSDHKDEIRRELDSMDDFEHLGHDSSPLKEHTEDLLGLHADAGSASKPIDIERVGQGEGNKVKMEGNFFEMGDAFPDRKEADEKLDKFLQEMAAPLKQHDVSPKTKEESVKSFMDNERDMFVSKSNEKDFLEKYSDHSDAESDDFKPSKYEDVSKKHELPESFGSIENLKEKQESNVEIKNDIVPPTKSVEKKEVLSEPINKIQEIIEEKKVQNVPKQENEDKIIVEENKEKSKQAEQKVIEAEALFKKMGLDAWFTPDKLHPTDRHSLDLKPDFVDQQNE